MAKRGRQTHKKRQREMTREQKHKDKAQRLAARKAGSDSPGASEAPPPPPDDDGKKKTLVITPIRRTAARSDRG